MVRTGITYHAICPGSVLTPAIEWRLRQRCGGTAPAWRKRTRTSSPSAHPRRFVKDDNVADLIAFLCSQQAEDINSSAMPIDGTWVAGCG
jgi:3-hydroxybutyrate dehydrogenase